jgi:hypothetical protein
MFPLGRSSRATMPLATGSATPIKTIGIVRVCRWMATVAGVEGIVTMISGCRPTNSCASARIRLLSPPAQRRSIRRQSSIPDIEQTKSVPDIVRCPFAASASDLSHRFSLTLGARDF